MTDHAEESAAARWLRLRGELARARAALSEASGRAARQRAADRVEQLEDELVNPDAGRDDP